MVRGTTPTYTFKLPQDIDLGIAETVYVTFSNKQYQTLLTKRDDDLDINNNTVSVFLSQEETLSIPKGEALVQINWIYDDGGKRKRACSKIIPVPVDRNLINEVI